MRLCTGVGEPEGRADRDGLGAAAVGAPLLLAEAVAVVAFGAAWLVKGRSIEALAGP